MWARKSVCVSDCNESALGAGGGTPRLTDAMTLRSASAAVTRSARTFWRLHTKRLVTVLFCSFRGLRRSSDHSLRPRPGNPASLSVHIFHLKHAHIQQVCKRFYFLESQLHFLNVLRFFSWSYSMIRLTIPWSFAKRGHMCAAFLLALIRSYCLFTTMAYVSLRRDLKCWRGSEKGILGRSFICDRNS